MIRGILTAAVVAGFGSVSAVAVTLLSFELSMDQSVQPPGDVLTVVAAFAPEENQLTLHIRALRVTPDDADTMEPIASDIAQHQDANGQFHLRVIINRAQATSIAKRTIIIPYRSLKLPVGIHRIAYEVRGVVEGKENFQTASRVTVVEVTRERRQKHERQIATTTTVRERRAITAYVLQNGRLRPRDVELEVPRVTKSVSTQVVSVDIPGAYHRREIDEVVRGELNAAKPITMLGDFVPAAKRQIYFATNRNLALPNEMGLLRFGDDIDNQTHFGACQVNIPIAHHVRGSLELPPHDWWRRKRDHFFLVELVSLLTEQQLLTLATNRDVLVFIHGYATSMPLAVLRTAQLQHDIEFPGQAMTFAWPSQGRIDRYAEDEKRALGSVDALANVLKLIVQRQVDSDSGRLHLIAHSMGNQLLLRAIERLEIGNQFAAKQKPFGSVVLAAADVSPETFQRCLPAVLKRADDVTYYYSLEDVALRASAALHGTPRIGAHPVMVAGVDTINADNVNSSFYFSLGHSYYAASDPVLTDLRLCLAYRLKPQQRRPPLGRRSLLAGLPHWEFDPVNTWAEMTEDQ
jgi:esterase/lipase superfamily enzyme